MSWQPIETAPKDGTRIVCWAQYWEDGPCFLRWKTNSRIVDAHKNNAAFRMAESYFGDPYESDDYDFSKSGNGPTHWHPIEPTPDLSS